VQLGASDQSERKFAMRRAVLTFGGLAIVLTLILGTASTASAAHFGNSKATLEGTGDSDAEGKSTVNFRKGTQSFNAAAMVSNLDAGETYVFLVRNAAGVEREVCRAEANSQGMFTCSAQDVLPDGFGLVSAVIWDAGGTEVAFGLYDRRGNCRVPDQAGSQCEAPGHQH
jgi:hypothetical protein